jgi:hypothetical protein
MRVTCPTCKTPVDLDDQAAGTLIRCRACGRSFVAPEELAVTGQPHTLTTFSVPGLVLLHFATLGLFPLVHFNLMHDRLPKIRSSDPSSFVAVALSFVPGLNLIWFFFTFRRLCVRINEQRRFAGLPETAPQSLAIILATLLLCGALSTILPLTGWVLLGTTVSVLAPVFVAVLQASVNELVLTRQPEAASQDHGHPHTAPDLRDRHRDLGQPGQRRPLAGASASRGDRT